MVGRGALLDDARYILRKLSNTRAAKLEDNPASRQMLLLGVVRYPLNLAPVSIGDARHVGRVRVFCNCTKEVDMLCIYVAKVICCMQQLSVSVTWVKCEGLLVDVSESWWGLTLLSLPASGRTTAPANLRPSAQSLRPFKCRQKKFTNCGLRRPSPT